MEARIFKPNEHLFEAKIFDGPQKPPQELKESVIANELTAKALVKLTTLEQKVKQLTEQGMVREMVDWSTYVTPGEFGWIHGELLHPIVSGNGVDYTMDELLPAVNTLINTPIYKVPSSVLGPEYVKNPENLHIDPDKRIYGDIKLVKAKGGAINFLAQVDDETYNQVKVGLLPRGSIEADFMVAAPSSKNSAQFKPEFIKFTGYLLLPAWAEPGDPATKNKVFETVCKGWNCSCPSKMLQK